MDSILQEPLPFPEQRLGAATVRSRLMLEVASEIVGRNEWPQNQVRVDLRAQGASTWDHSLFASDGPDAIADVLSGRASVAILNPATVVHRAARRFTGSTEMPLAAIATIPSYDQLGLAVARHTGLASLEDLPRAAPALTVSLRGGRPNHSVHLVVEDTLAAVGMTLGDIESWGGTVRYDEGHVQGPIRLDGMRDGTFDTVVDEGIYNWAELAIDAGMRFLALSDETLRRLEAQGYRRATLRQSRYARLEQDVPTVDFSGFLIYTRADADEAVVTAFCEALAASRDRIPWQGGPHLPLEHMVADTVDAPLPIPLHPAAERVWRDEGYLPVEVADR